MVSVSDVMVPVGGLSVPTHPATLCHTCSTVVRWWCHLVSVSDVMVPVGGLSVVISLSQLIQPLSVTLVVQW